LVLGGREWWNRQTPKWGEKINQHDHAWKTGRIKIWNSGSLPRLLKPIHNSRAPRSTSTFYRFEPFISYTPLSASHFYVLEASTASL
jgi:hypothetical protein